MTKTDTGKNISVCALFYMALTSSFNVAVTREKSAHFCRYSRASHNIR
ncbi:MAG: hypothetical protein PHZ09_05820 [Eubacteriales bacterium]|nr:hypothetical protein [Eubacteriales bacterium]